MILLLFITASASATVCEPGWSFFKNNCYKHIYNVNNQIRKTPAEAECARRGAYLTSLESPEELNFVAELASRLGDWSSTSDAMKEFPVFPALSSFPRVSLYRDALMVGGIRDSNKRWSWPRSSSTWINWCKPTEPTLGNAEQCLILYKLNNNPCLYDTDCDTYYNEYYHYVCKKPAPPKPTTPKPTPPPPCKAGAERKSNGQCACKAGYFDIAETDCPERKNYKKGEMCISRTPCQNIITSKTSFSIIFVVDSSQSIGASNWNNVVQFLKTGSKLLDNSIDVGFVQFSTNVSYSSWLPRWWEKNDYLDQTPSNFDAGYTNTPAALEEALRMFKQTRTKHQVAVLITDGMPYVEDILPKEIAMDKTIEAAETLRRAGVELVALGYGPELQNYQSYLKKILENSSRDYFEYDKEADHLKEIHMTVLLNKVCSRFQ